MFSVKTETKKGPWKNEYIDVRADIFVGFLGELKTPQFPFEIAWALAALVVALVVAGFWCPSHSTISQIHDLLVWRFKTRYCAVSYVLFKEDANA